MRRWGGGDLVSTFGEWRLVVFDYIRDPEEIHRRSSELIRAQADLHRLPAEVAEVAVRLVHACGMLDIVDDLVWTDEVVGAGRAALVAGAPVVADSRMVSEGVIRSRLPAGNAVICKVNEPDVAELAARIRTTRSAAAVDRWRSHLAGAVVAIGNAPTALFRLLEVLAEGAPRPAAILAFPVGFVGASEAKEALVDSGLGVPYLTLLGRRGGSAMAAAAVNALAGGPFR